jgi:hypothetical protein
VPKVFWPFLLSFGVFGFGAFLSMNMPGEREFTLDHERVAGSGILGGSPEAPPDAFEQWMRLVNKGIPARQFASEAIPQRGSPLVLQNAYLAISGVDPEITVGLLRYTIPDGERAIIRQLGLFAARTAGSSDPFGAPPVISGFRLIVNGVSIGTLEAYRGFFPGIVESTSSGYILGNTMPPPYFVGFDAATSAFTLRRSWNFLPAAPVLIHLTPGQTFEVLYTKPATAAGTVVEASAVALGWRWPINFEADDIRSLFGG